MGAGLSALVALVALSWSDGNRNRYSNRCRVMDRDTDNDVLPTCPDRNQGASDGVMDGLALFMGHSVKEQRSTYDRRTKAQKVAPAVQLIQGLNMGSEGGSQGKGA